MTEDIVVQDREELLDLLCEAAEFEHTVMATYLYAGWSPAAMLGARKAARPLPMHGRIPLPPQSP